MRFTKDRLSKIRATMELKQMSQEELWKEYYRLYSADMRGEFRGKKPSWIPLGASWTTKESADAGERMTKIMDIVDDPRSMCNWAADKFAEEIK